MSELTIQAVIEISQDNNDMIKYEIAQTGELRVDRIMKSVIPYPANYGFVPHTLAPDGDCTDILVVFPNPLPPTAHIQCRVIGALDMTDEHGHDIKLIAVPISTITDMYDHVQEIEDLTELMRDRINNFFTSYKMNEPDDVWSRVDGWLSKDEAVAALTGHYMTFRKRKHRPGER